MQMNHPNLVFTLMLLFPLETLYISFFVVSNLLRMKTSWSINQANSPQVSKKKNLKFYPDAIPVKGNTFWVPSPLYIIFSLAALSTYRILVPSFLPIQLQKYHLYSLYTTGKERKSLCRSMDYIVSPGKTKYQYSLT